MDTYTFSVTGFFAITAMNFVPNNSYLHMLLVLLIFGVLCLITYFVSKYSDVIAQEETFLTEKNKT